MPTPLTDNDLFVDFEEPFAGIDSEGRSLTAEQAAFFYGSKCVDEENNLLVLYHASPNNFTEFDAKRIGTGGGSIYGNGFYFCDCEHGLEEYGHFIKEFYLNLRNPFIWEYEADQDNFNAFIAVLESNNYGMTEDLYQKLLNDVLKNGCYLDTLITSTCGEGLAQKYFIRAGYDGIINLDIGDYVAFDPKQIKLCSNKKPKQSANIAA